MNSSGHIVELISGFPDFKVQGFDIEVYNQQFRQKNSVINASSKNISYDKHWGPLSLKFSIGGNENYLTSHCNYAVNDSNFLLLNHDTEYASYIDEDTEVESFTLNFSEQFTNTFYAVLVSKQEDVLENNLEKKKQKPRFIERLYAKDDIICPVAENIYRCLNDFTNRNDEVAELFAELFCALLKHNVSVQSEIESIQKTKLSTRQELYRRLNYAKDYIDSCYYEDINLDTISAIACLNREYLIRQFKNYFKTTPAQYLISRRMEAAKNLLQTEDLEVREVCQRVGYSDLSSFGKLFRRYYRVSPLELKKNEAKS